MTRNVDVKKRDVDLIGAILIGLGPVHQTSDHSMMHPAKWRCPCVFSLIFAAAR